MGDITIKHPLCPEDSESVRGFFRKMYREDIAVGVKSVFDWQFSKDRDDGCFNIIAAYDNDRVVGTLGYVPVKAFWGGFEKAFNFSYAINWMFQPEYAAMSWAFIRKLKKISDGIISTHQSEHTDRLVLADGWAVRNDICRLVRVIDGGRAESITSNDIKPFIKEIAKGQAEPLSTGVYAPDWRLYESMAYGAVRDADFIRWRYERHPGFKYHVFFSGDLKRPAVCAFRIAEAFGEFSCRVLKITDLFHPSDEAGRRDGINLLNFVLQKAKDDGCVYADCFTVSPEISATAAACGFLPDNANIFPSRLTPVQRISDGSNYIFTARTETGNNVEHIYLSPSDADMDRVSSSRLLTV